MTAPDNLPAPHSRFVVAGCKPWNRSIFDSRLRLLPGEWFYIDDPSLMTTEHISSIGPRYVFFLHWSWRVPPDITAHWECLCFHMTDLPFGRGGSPLQNLIRRGIDETVLTAFQMTEELDAGPIYSKVPMSLHGTAEEILVRATERAADMIQDLVENRPVPVPQEGETVLFRRRNPAESEFPVDLADLKECHDFIRMLDGAGYPRAFFRVGNFRVELSRACLYDGKVIADATITIDQESGS